MKNSTSVTRYGLTHYGQPQVSHYGLRYGYSKGQRIMENIMDSRYGITQVNVMDKHYGSTKETHYGLIDNIRIMDSRYGKSLWAKHYGIEQVSHYGLIDNNSIMDSRYGRRYGYSTRKSSWANHYGLIDNNRIMEKSLWAN